MSTIYAETPTPNKQGVNIDGKKYKQIEQAILKVLSKEKEVEFKTLSTAVEKKLNEPFEGSIPWYTTTVKLDMETRGIIKRVPGSRPQRLQLG